MSKREDVVWRAEIATPPPGRYRYKFIVDGVRWTEDPANNYKGRDAYGGFNSLLSIV